MTRVNTSKPIEIEDAEDVLRVSFFLVGVPPDPDAWGRAFDFVSAAETSQNPVASYLAAKRTSDGDVVIQATVPLGDVATLTDDVLDAVDSFIEAADARYEVTNSKTEAAHALVQNWWVRRVAQS